MCLSVKLAFATIKKQTLKEYMKKETILLSSLFAVLLFVGVGCNRVGVGINNEQTGTTGTTTTSSGSTSPVTAAINDDCVAANCPQIVIQGDSPAKLPNGQISPFSGMADPSMRKDLTSNRIWLAYSWPNIHVVGQKQDVTSVDAHLAYSDDSGKTWNYDMALWPSNATTDKGGTNAAGYMSHETPNLLPVQNGNSENWYGVRLAYFVPDSGIKSRPVNSFQLNIMEASSPEALANAPMQTLGSSVTSAGWGVNVNLASLSPAVKKCDIWNEPALYWQDNTLYLSTFCQTYSGKTIDASQSDFEIFSTPAQGAVQNWKWSYVGELTNGSIAEELGQPGTTQMDIARGSKGQLLAILSPYHYDASAKDNAHTGCDAVEISSINPPTFAHDSSGKLIVDAAITASDQGELGPAACTYDPASVTGMLMTKRVKSSSQFISTVNVTGVRP